MLLEFKNAMLAPVELSYPCFNHSLSLIDTRGDRSVRRCFVRAEPWQLRSLRLVAHRRAYIASCT